MLVHIHTLPSVSVNICLSKCAWFQGFDASALYKCHDRSIIANCLDKRQFLHLTWLANVNRFAGEKNCFIFDSLSSTPTRFVVKAVSYEAPKRAEDDYRSGHSLRPTRWLCRIWASHQRGDQNSTASRQLPPFPSLCSSSDLLLLLLPPLPQIHTRNVIRLLRV